MKRTAAAVSVTVALLAAGCGDQGGLEILRVCGDDTAATSDDPRCSTRDGFRDEPDGKGQGMFRPRGF